MARKKCSLCDKEKPKGRQYITTSLAKSTIRINGLRLCEDHGDQLKDAVWEVIIGFLRGEDPGTAKLVFKKTEDDVYIAILDDEDNETFQDTLTL